VKFMSHWLNWSPENPGKAFRTPPLKPSKAAFDGSGGSLPRALEHCKEFVSRSDTKAARVIRTENQCGQCLGWRLSVLVELDHGQRIYLCQACLDRRSPN
jgi:hypothetical protein